MARQVPGIQAPQEGHQDPKVNSIVGAEQYALLSWPLVCTLRTHHAYNASKAVCVDSEINRLLKYASLTAKTHWGQIVISEHVSAILKGSSICLQQGGRQATGQRWS